MSGAAVAEGVRDEVEVAEAHLIQRAFHVRLAERCLREGEKARARVGMWQAEEAAVQEASDGWIINLDGQILACFGLAKEERAVLVRLTEAMVDWNANVAAPKLQAFIDPQVAVEREEDSEGRVQLAASSKPSSKQRRHVARDGRVGDGVLLPPPAAQCDIRSSELPPRLGKEDVQAIARVL